MSATLAGKTTAPLPVKTAWLLECDLCLEVGMSQASLRGGGQRELETQGWFYDKDLDLLTCPHCNVIHPEKI